MENDRKKTGDMRRFLPGTSASDLMGKQSVRATFRLSSEAAKMLSIVSAHMRIRQKALLDYLAEDGKTLQIIAGQIPAQDSQRKKKIPKTFVLSRKTLHSLDDTAREYHIPRDLLAENLILCLRPLLSEEQEKHRKRIGVLRETESVLKAGEKILETSSASLGQDDPLYMQLEKMLSAFGHAYRQIADLVEKGRAAEEYPAAFHK